MASTVLSGASNPSYRNNTDQNVRIVINYMAGTGGNTSTLTINWAGVSVSTSSDQGNIAIGRNLAYSQLFRDTASGGTQQVQVGLERDQFGNIIRDSRGPRSIFQAVGVNNSVALAAASNNAAGFVSSLPTELMLAPGQTFSAVCSVHNIVVIPENG
jgi:hypothetical protein